MTKNQRKPFWHNKIAFTAYYFLVLVLLIYSLFTGKVDSQRWPGYLLSHQSNWILCYLILGFWVSLSVFFITFKLAQKMRVTCLTYLKILAAIYLLQVLAYICFSGFHWMLMIPMVIVVPMSIAIVYNRLKPKKCVKCGKQARFMLFSYEHKDSKRYCYEHFMSSLHNSLNRYKGKFIITGRQESENQTSAQYCFYLPKDMLDDSYTDPDIEAAIALIESSFNGETDDIKAVLIPGDAIKDISKFDDTPLFSQPIESIKKTPMTQQELISYLESTLAAFDCDGHEFHMDRPHSANGIYIWHNYI